MKYPNPSRMAMAGIFQFAQMHISRLVEKVGEAENRSIRRNNMELIDDIVEPDIYRVISGQESLIFQKPRYPS